MVSPPVDAAKHLPPWRLASLARWGRYVAPTVECAEPGCETRILKSAQRHGLARCPEHARPGRIRHARWTFTCTRCGEIREYRPRAFRYNRERGQHPEAVIDESTGQGTYTCRPCTQRGIAKASPVGRRIAYLRKKGGRALLAKRAADLRAKMTPEQLQMGLDKAAATNRGRPPTSEERRRRSWSHIAPRPRGRFGLCRVCSFLVHSDGSDRAETHRDCLNNWRRGRRFAFSAYPPPRTARHLSSPEELADSFEMAVRDLLRGEDVGRWKGGEGLAAYFGLPRSTINDRIDAFLAKFAPDGRGGKTLARWAKILRAAKARREAKARRVAKARRAKA